MDPSELQASFTKTTVKPECSNYEFSRPEFNSYELSREEFSSYDFSREEFSSNEFSRDRHRRFPSAYLGGEQEKNDTETKLITMSSWVKVNGKGEPEGYCATQVSKELTSVVQKHVKVETMWSLVTAEVRYRIYQELQDKFPDGRRIDKRWILLRARKIHDSRRNKARNALWRTHCYAVTHCGYRVA